MKGKEVEYRKFDIEMNWRFHEILSFGSPSYSFVEWADFSKVTETRP